jgi:hypothetical protein
MPGLTEIGRQWNDAVESAPFDERSGQPWNTLGFSDPGMTHEAEQPNPVPGIIKPMRDYLHGGLPELLQNRGVQLPDWVNQVNDFLHNENLNTAVGVSSPIKGMGLPARAASEGAAELGALGAKLPGEALPAISERVKSLGGDWANRPVIDPQGNVIHNPIGSEHVGGPILRLNEDGSLSKGILAYHGSPHDFDRFDLSKIGTGEGAQAFGHGLYFAENEAVAKQYRDLLSTRGGAVDDPVSRAQFWASDLGGRDAAIKHLESVLVQGKRYPKNFDTADLGKTQQAIDYLKSGGDLTPKAGHTYQVSIKADPEHFLDWDKPLSEQHPKVQEAMLSIPEVAKQHKFQTEFLGQDKGLTGAGAYAAASKWTRGASLSPSDPAALTDQLRQAGIPGIKYLDQGSRGIRTPQQARDMLPAARQELSQSPDNRQLQIAVKQLERDAAAPEPTRNYVVFNADTIDILKKYGLLGLFGGAASQIGSNPGQR